MTESSEEGLSIGALARSTGISIHCLRVWERRYGSPRALRRASGHRRYPLTEVPRMRAVARALAAGFRASQVAGASIEEVDRLLASLGAKPHRRERAPEPNTLVQERVDEWIRAAIDFDEGRLSEAFEADWNTLGPVDFVIDRAVPFLKVIGDTWQRGRLMVAQEHFACEQLSDYFASKWRTLNTQRQGRPLVLATLPKDQHRLGIQMAAILCCHAGQRIVFLGSQVPVEEIAEVARRQDAVYIVLSISSTLNSRYAHRCVTELSTITQGRIPIIAGGGGAPPTSENCLALRDLGKFHAWMMSAPADKYTALHETIRFELAQGLQPSGASQPLA